MRTTNHEVSSWSGNRRRRFPGLGAAVILSLASWQIAQAGVQTCIEGDCDHSLKHCERRAGESAAHRQDICDKDLRRHLGNCNYDDEEAQRRCKQYAVDQWTNCQKYDDQNSDKDIQQCEDAYDSCVKQCKKDYGGSSQAGYRTEDCPPGTRPNPLGTCGAVFGSPTPLAPGVGGCPPGQEPGHDGGCRPKLNIKVVPLADGYLVACPKGMRPSPVDGGCIFDGGGMGGADPNDERCPPGTAPGPDDGPCVPKVRAFTPTESLNDLLRSIAATSVLTRRSPPLEFLQEIDPQVVRTTDPVRTLDGIAEQLGMEWEK